MSSADVAFVAAHERAMVSGVAAAVEFGEPLEADRDESDLYLSSSLQEELASLVALVPDQLGRVVLRVVPDDVWPVAASPDASRSRAGRRLAPPAAVALDLMASGDPRHWVAAANLVDSRD